MAYIIQQRRDTLKNWNEINPVLADSEIGFILDLDEKTGKQKSSLYKIGDGSTAWKDLPLFGFNGNISKDFAESDLDTSVPTSQSVLDKINSEISNLEYKLINGDDDVEGLSNKLSVTQLVQTLSPNADHNATEPEFENTEENPLSWEEVEEVTKDQIVSRWILIQEFQQIWNDFGDMEDRIILDEKNIETLQKFADTFGTSFTTYQEATDKKLSEHDTELESHKDVLDKHEQDIYGWEEQKETGETDEETGEPIIETIKHKGFDEKISDVQTSYNEGIIEVNKKIEDLRTEINAKHNILTEVEFAEIDDFSSYPDGTLFYTYKEQGV